MKYLLALILLGGIGTVVAHAVVDDNPVVVPAVRVIEVPPRYAQWGCSDQTRVLLMAEDGTGYCLNVAALHNNPTFVLTSEPPAAMQLN